MRFWLRGPSEEAWEDAVQGPGNRLKTDPWVKQDQYSQDF